MRTHHTGSRIINFWWLPVEYWVMTAREMGRSDEEIAQVRSVFRNYAVLGSLDVDVKPDGSMSMASTADIVRRLELAVNGVPAEVLQQVDPRLQTMAGEFSYPLVSSLGPLARGLHLLPLANINADGQAIVHGVARGRIQAIYKPSAETAPIEVEWYAPLTAVAGSRRCPAGGEQLEAAFRYCPFHGVELPTR